MKKWKNWFCMLMLVTLPGISAWAQSNPDAPQIATTDLLRRQKSSTEILNVSFVIYDTDKVSQVLVNEQPVSFQPAETVVVNQSIKLSQGKNLIQIVAVDEAGNQREKRYLVSYKDDKELTQEEEKQLGLLEEDTGSDKKDEKKLNWMVVVGAKYETDTNPSNDVGLPVKIGDIELTGVIDDAEQEDIRTSLNAMVLFMYDKWTAFVGASNSSYTKSIYESLSSTALILGAGMTPTPTENGMVFNYLFLDINLGGENYGQNHGFDVGYQFGHANKKEDVSRHILSLGYTLKLLASNEADTGSEQKLKYEYNNIDKEQLDSHKTVFSYGLNSDGTSESEYSFLTFDFDWFNKWEMGLLFDIGFGMHYRNYPNVTPLSAELLGDTRTDVPIRLSTALGWQFLPAWSVKYGYNYKINVSNKSLYQKTVHGLSIDGSF
ncbi:MAG: hypothetical protein HQM11_09505 [SAR324 cluster bacterium]|nr:hypothetical protein [SAR324 cluster bacterium]